MLLSDIDIISYSDWHWILTNSGQLNLRLTQGMLGLFVGIENHRNVMKICWSHGFCQKLSDHTKQTRGTFRVEEPLQKRKMLRQGEHRECS